MRIFTMQVTDGLANIFFILRDNSLAVKICLFFNVPLHFDSM